MPFSQYTPKRVQQKSAYRRPWRLPLLLAAAVVCLGLLMAPTGGGGTAHVAEALPPAPSPTPEPVPTPTPVPEPTPTPVPPYDFSQSAPEREPVEMEYFQDALFIGDSRTDGLRLYSGITGADFYCYKGLTVFEMGSRKVAEVDGKKMTVLEALEQGKQYAKIYISLGINELGGSAEGYAAAFSEFLTQVKTLQPQAVVYLETVVPVNPGKCRANGQPYYVTNDKVYAFNEALFPLAEEKQVVLLDIAAAFSDEEGVLPRDDTVDGVHFTKPTYQEWLSYLMSHTVDSQEYAAGQAVPALPAEQSAPPAQEHEPEEEKGETIR